MTEPTANRPNLVAVAGPNGAGKSTVGPRLLKETLGVTKFVNADLIAQGLAGYEPEGAAFEAGRIMIERLRQLARHRTDFAFETTLSGRAYARWIGGLARTGYRFHLVFLWLPSATFAVERVRDRVALGGHHVPEEVVRRRFRAGLENFFDLYRPLCATWRLYDNSSAGPPRLVAFGQGVTEPEVRDPSRWGEILRMTER